MDLDDQGELKRDSNQSLNNQSDEVSLNSTEAMMLRQPKKYGQLGFNAPSSEAQDLPDLMAQSLQKVQYVDGKPLGGLVKAMKPGTPGAILGNKRAKQQTIEELQEEV